MEGPLTDTAKHPLVIVNPHAGRGRAGRALPDMLGALRDALGELDVAETTHAGHAVALAAGAAADRRPLVIGVGGDGTLNEVVNGLLAAGGATGGGRAGAADPAAARQGAAALPRLGVLTTGTGGDFGRALGIAHRPEAYLAAISGGGERLVDAGWARFAGAHGRPAERYWINVLSAGLGGLVDRYAAATPGFVGGRLAYAQATVRALLVARRVPLRCRAVLPGGDIEERILRAYAVAVCNGTSFGGGMAIAPTARPDDGVLEVVTIETESRWLLLRRLGTVYTGTHLSQPGVGHFSCTSLELGPVDAPAASSAGQPARRKPRAGLFPLDVDGDALGDVPLRIEVVPAALRVCAPRI